ncbi:chloride channel protein [Legionella lytica]|uniref:Chloride channel protein n=1 Tax=Legionella lytica TaxID=96232 RepID=A0ABW8D8H4_9GAMM
MELLEEPCTNSKTSIGILMLVTIGVGIGSGLIGMTLALLLHYLQHIAYGYSSLHIISPESFLEGVSASSPTRRLLVLGTCGLVAGGGWFIIQRFGKPLVSIAQAIKTGEIMPPLTTTCHALIQIITIALGSPLGREVAPREAAAVFATWLSHKAGLTVDETKVMLACGAGAGLAAVYNLPLGGAVFVMEVLLFNFHWSILLPAFATSAIATVVSWWGLGQEATYHISELTSINASLTIWSVVVGPILGFLAFWFINIANRQRTEAFRGWPMFFACLANFIMIGFLAIYFPSLLGNGKSAAQLEFSQLLSIGMSLVILILRSFVVWTSLRSGAWGGLLTPSLANGALLGVFLGGIWNFIWPGTPLVAYAVIGAAAFLAAAQKMPLTATIIIFEFTRVDFVFLAPVMFAVCGAVGGASLVEKWLEGEGEGTL